MSVGLSAFGYGVGVGVDRQQILDRQGWRCRACGDPLSDESPVCSMTVPDGPAIVCSPCGSRLNRLRAMTRRL